MPGKALPPNQHQRTRRDHAGETAEDYAEAIAECLARNGRCRVIDLAKRFAVSHVTVSKIIARLQKQGLVDTQPYAPITLTKAGQALAHESQQRHEVVVAFLLALGVSERVANVDAEGIEHHVSRETLAKMREIVHGEARITRGN